MSDVFKGDLPDDYVGAVESANKLTEKLFQRLKNGEITKPEFFKKLKEIQKAVDDLGYVF